MIAQCVRLTTLLMPALKSSKTDTTKTALAPLALVLASGACYGPKCCCFESSSRWRVPFSEQGWLMRQRLTFDEPAVTIGSRPLRYMLTTSVGALDLVVDPALSRRAANSFVFLVGQGFYDGLTFHRVVPGFIAQTGCPLGAGHGDAGYLFDGETPRKHVYRRGDVALASSGSVDGRGAHGSQFFVCLADLPRLAPVYPLLGHVVGSAGTLDRLNGLAISAQGSPATEVKVVSARLVAG